jgi:hypothetical protein
VPAWVSSQFGGIEVHKLREVEVDGLVTEGEVCFKPRRGGRVVLDGVGKGGRR